MENETTARVEGTIDPLLANRIATAICAEFFLARSKGVPDCGPCFLDDDDAEEQLREIVCREMANAEAHGRAVARTVQPLVGSLNQEGKA